MNENIRLNALFAIAEFLYNLSYVIIRCMLLRVHPSFLSFTLIHLLCL